MAGQAQDTIARFWQIQDSGDYTQLVDLFAEDALVEDPVWGTYNGRDAIMQFMTTMVKEMKQQEADVSDADVWSALRTAQADGFVAALAHVVLAGTAGKVVAVRRPFPWTMVAVHVRP